MGAVAQQMPPLAGRREQPASRLGASSLGLHIPREAVQLAVPNTLPERQQAVSWGGLQAQPASSWHEALPFIPASARQEAARQQQIPQPAVLPLPGLSSAPMWAPQSRLPDSSVPSIAPASAGPLMQASSPSEPPTKASCVTFHC